MRQTNPGAHHALFNETKPGQHKICIAKHAILLSDMKQDDFDCDFFLSFGGATPTFGALPGQITGELLLALENSKRLFTSQQGNLLCYCPRTERFFLNIKRR